MLCVWKGQCTVKPLRPRRDGGGSWECEAEAESVRVLESASWPMRPSVTVERPSDDFEVAGLEGVETGECSNLVQVSVLLDVY